MSFVRSIRLKGRAHRDDLIVAASDLAILALIQFYMCRPISEVHVTCMICPRNSPEYHQLGIVVILSVAENLHHVVVATWNLIPNLLAQGTDCLCPVSHVMFIQGPVYRWSHYGLTAASTHTLSSCGFPASHDEDTVLGKEFTVLRIEHGFIWNVVVFVQELTDILVRKYVRSLRDVSLFSR